MKPSPPDHTHATRCYTTTSSIADLSKRSPHSGSWRPHFAGRSPLTWRAKANGSILHSATEELHVKPPECMLSLRHVRSESGEGLFVGPWMGMCSAPKGVRRVRCKATDFTFDNFLRLFSGPISPIYFLLRCFYRPHKPEPKKATKRYV